MNADHHLRGCGRRGFLFLLAITLPLSAALGASSDRAALPGSILEVTPADQTPRPHNAQVITAALTHDEESAPLELEVALKVRRFPELEQRVKNGEIIAPEVMAVRYLPLESDYDAVTTWLRSAGLTISRSYNTRVSVFVRGSAAQLASAFQVQFAQVQFEGVAYTAAITAPSVPSEISPLILSVNGLQPYLHPRPIAHPLASGRPQTNNQPPYLVPEILHAYDADNSSLNGANQEIAIIVGTIPLVSDLNAFYQANGINRSASFRYFYFPSGSPPPPSGEETLDVSWSTGVASNLSVLIYAIGENGDFLGDPEPAYAQLLSDLQNSAEPTLHQLSMSYGASEAGTPSGTLSTDHQYFVMYNAYGVTNFASSGDAGAYNAGFNRDVNYPASDDAVTGVGGTSLQLSSSTGAVTSETAWSDTGGGVSAHFSRPAWQHGTGFPPGSTRCIPDVALDADPNTGVYLVLNGSASQQYGGTSLSAPVWAAFCARLNQARANLNLAPIALLSPSLYPLLGSPSFRDITSGNNGYYNAGTGYDLCTGLGVPQVTELLETINSNLPKVDFNRDGKPDLALFNPSTQRVALWYLNNNVLATTLFAPTPSSGWALIDVADFNRDGYPDYLLYNSSTQQTEIWYLNGTTFLSSEPGPTIASGYTLIGAADFNGDGHPDYLLYNPTTRRTAIWYLNNYTYTGSAYGPTITAGYHLAGLADFNGDGKVDYVLFNPSTRRTAIWYLSGATYAGSAYGPTITSGYQLIGAADFNTDARPDYLLYNPSTHRSVIWYLNNNLYLNSALGPIIATGYTVVAP